MQCILVALGKQRCSRGPERQNWGTAARRNALIMILNVLGVNVCESLEIHRMYEQ